MNTPAHSATVNDRYADQLGRELRNAMPQASVTTLKYEGASSVSSVNRDTRASVVVLSPQAQALTKGQIALEVLLGVRTAQATPTTTQAAQSSTTSSAGTVADAVDDPSRPSLTDFLKLSPADQFYLTTNPDDFVGIMTDDQAAQFKAAYAARTLNIQDASKVPDLDYKSKVTYFNGVSGNGETGSFTYNSALAGERYGPNCFIGGGVAGPGFLVTY